MYMVVHLCIGVWWRLVALWHPLTQLPYLPYDGLERLNGYAYYYRPLIEDEWLIAARNRPLLTIVVLCGLS
jgi:hypothetical protein